MSLRSVCQMGFWVGAAVGLAACAAPPQWAAVESPAISPTGLSQPLPGDASPPYFNRYTPFRETPWEVMRWKLNALAMGLPAPPQQATPLVSPDLAFIQANALAGADAVPAVTWVGHATALVQMPSGGTTLNWLTDPMFSDRASPVSFAGPKRAQPPGLSLAQLPRIDLVVVSHNHYDHLDRASVQRLNAQSGGPPLFFVPKGLKAWMNEAGIVHVVELRWWDHVMVGDARVTLVPAQHWSARGLSDRLETLWGGFVVASPQFKVYWAGDTADSPDFDDIARHFFGKAPTAGEGFDLALIPIGAYEPAWFMARQHINPSEAVGVHRRVGARHSLGVHWGTFALSDESLDQPPRDLVQALTLQGVSALDFRVLPVGGTWKLPRRDASDSKRSPAK